VKPEIQRGDFGMPIGAAPDSSSAANRSPLESTAALLDRVRVGDDDARERLFARFLPILTRWAHRRLPVSARDTADTHDLVQVTLLRAFNNLERFDARGEGAFLAYLRQILLNLVRDEIRRAVRTAPRTELPAELAGSGPSVVEEVVGRDLLQRYEAALAALPPEMQEAVILRIELGYSHQAVADALRKPSADAARVMVARALVKIAQAM
jgi:RNA polymerase sigma-70 factor (ECF subfamily)